MAVELLALQEENKQLRTKIDAILGLPRSPCASRVEAKIGGSTKKMDLLPWNDGMNSTLNVQLEVFKQPAEKLVLNQPHRGLLRIGTASRVFITDFSHQHQHYWNGTDSDTFADSVNVKLVVAYQFDKDVKSLSMDIVAEVVNCHADPDAVKSNRDVGMYQDGVRISLEDRVGKEELDVFADAILAAICKKCWCDDLCNSDVGEGDLKESDRMMGGKWNVEKWGDAAVDCCFGRICTFSFDGKPCKLVHSWSKTQSGIDVALSVKMVGADVWQASLDLEPEFPAEGLEIKEGVISDELRIKLIGIMNTKGSTQGSMIVKENRLHF
jgi:hypothetical protein